MPRIEDFKFSSSSIDETCFPNVGRRRTASAGRMRVGSAGDLVGFVRVAHDKLVHLSQQDFWKVGQDKEGFYIERLVDDTSGPISDN